MTYYLIALALGRIALGLAPLVAAGPASRLLGFPEAHDTPTTRLFGRLFGIRDIGLGLLLLWVISDPVALRWVLIFNIFHDAADAIVISVPLLKRQGIDKGAGLSLGFACGGLVCWLIALLLN